MSVTRSSLARHLVREQVRTSAETPRVARSIIDQLMSPFCPGLTLQACPSPSADSLRRDIISRVRAGESETAILNRLYTDFGTAIRGAPESEGFGLVAWTAPAFALVVTIVFVTRWLRSVTRRSRSATISNTTIPVAPMAQSAGFSEEEHRKLATLLRNN